jgi:uncharacterized iron-regulated membrane protein
MRLPLRKLVFWLHLGVAVMGGLVILLLAATGLLLAYEAQIRAWADRDARLIDPIPGGSALPAPLESTLGAIAAAHPDLPVTAVTLARDADEALVLALGRDGVLYVDPYRAVATGSGSTGVAACLKRMTELHRYVGAAGERRPLGKGMTGAANLAFLAVLLSGLYLWVPRVWTRAQLRRRVWFRRGLDPTARDLNWHHVLGLMTAAPLVLIVVSALPISYAWAGDLLLWITASPRAAAATSPSSSAGARTAGATTATLGDMDLDGLERVVAGAMAAAPDWRSLTVRLPLPDDGRVAISADASARRGRPDLRTQLVLDRASGALVSREGFAEQSAGRRARSWMRWIHTGEAGGLPGQTLAALACAATLVLGWTGMALAWRRLLQWRRRTATREEAHGELAREVSATNYRKRMTHEEA